MALNKNNILLRGFIGSIGKQLVIRQRGSKTILSNSPKINPNRLPTSKQQQILKKFKWATKYAISAVKDPDLKLLYQAAAAEGQSAYNVAVSDAFQPPVLSELNTKGYTGQPGDKISVLAIDNFMVKTVHFAIIKDGAILEEGDGIKDENGLQWHYSTKKLNRNVYCTVIRLVAQDLPGNQATLEQIL